MDDIVEKAFLNAVDIDNINKEFAEKVVVKLEKSIGIKSVKKLINEWDNGTTDLPHLLKLLDIGLPELRFAIKELNLMSDEKFDNLVRRGISRE
ncbi:MAG: hypothetical protein ACP6IS_10425 [Candidatus Asgardarchaeia archaeon]